ncbi:SDR family oxidoreductase [Pseudonocardia charpentierae]|uniref:NAD(P)H-binding protein n=1 Tax=Pseudonocardia charpentierae TaxID=3075545 RepID=A0ABU2N5J6_9PSEU|nr:NAD(P)H-binding protein [Pseudonocardia sp. DSM 45834]MDT0349203.1 NAD(P)H-binding protein [Pseudonocardia sp. DSM 45834]
MISSEASPCRSAQIASAVSARSAAGVERLVVLSRLGSVADSPVRFLRYHAAVEQHVRDSGLDFTFLRPNLYFQGLFAVAGSIVGNGVLPLRSAVREVLPP